MKSALRLERVLFVVGPRHAGKSTQLRSVFRDRRLGSGGRIRSERRVDEVYDLSNERRLYLRLTSPHESHESLSGFIRKTRGKMDRGRWCYLGPLQSQAANRMPDVLGSVRGFIKAFRPERVRVVFLSPTRTGDSQEWQKLSPRLFSLGAEVACIDARDREANGLFLADYFDFQ